MRAASWCCGDADVVPGVSTSNVRVSRVGGCVERVQTVSVIGVDSATRLLAGRYLLERLLGRGGMAMVYAGRDRRLDRQVAIKIVPVAVTEPVGRARFMREARSAAGLSHPNAVAVFDAGEADGYLYIVMELVEGRSLGDVLAEAGPLEPAQATAIAASVLAALGQAHDAGIVHRDVKPSNIMLSYDGTVKLLDFGIARRLDDLAAEVTVAGEIVGTPTYLTPEQLEGRATTPATDVYAVGVVLFEMLAGVPPFNGGSPAATAFAHVNAPVPDVRSLRPDVPAWLAVTVRKAMAKDPAQRYGGAAAMQAALTEGSGDATAVLRPSTQEPTQVLAPGGYDRRRRPWWLAGVAALAVAGLVVWNVGTGLFSFITSGDPPEQRSASASPTSTSIAVTTTATPTTIAGVIAALQANPEAYGQQHTTAIVDELVNIEQGDAAAERAASLLDQVAAWVDNAEVTPATLALLEPVLTPLIDTQPEEVGDDGSGSGNGNGVGNGNGNGGNGGGNGNGGNGNGNGNANGHNKKH